MARKASEDTSAELDALKKEIETLRRELKKNTAGQSSSEKKTKTAADMAKEALHQSVAEAEEWAKAELFKYVPKDYFDHARQSLESYRETIKQRPLLAVTGAFLLGMVLGKLGPHK